MTSWLAKNFWLKIIALILAVIVWFYARQEIRYTAGYRDVNATQDVYPAQNPRN